MTNSHSRSIKVYDVTKIRAEKAATRRPHTQNERPGREIGADAALRAGNFVNKLSRIKQPQESTYLGQRGQGCLRTGSDDDRYHVGA